MITLTAIISACVSVLFIIGYNYKKNGKVETTTILSNQNKNEEVKSKIDCKVCRSFSPGVFCKLDELITGNYYYYVIDNWNSGPVEFLQYFGVAIDQISLGYSQPPIVNRRHCFLQKNNKMLKLNEKLFISSLDELSKKRSGSIWALRHPCMIDIGHIKYSDTSIEPLCISKERLDNE